MFEGACKGFDAEVVVESHEALVDELPAVIGDYLVRYAESAHYVLPHDILNISSSNGG